MKKGLLLIMMIVILASGCSSLNEIEKINDKQGQSNDQEGQLNNKVEEMDVKKLSIDDFYPYLENTVLEYEGIGNEFAEQKSYFEFIDGYKAQIKIENSGTAVVKVIEKKDGLLKEIFSEGEFYHIENLLDNEAVKEEVLLKEPLELGNSWKNSEGNTREITGLEVEIKTPYETFKALEVTTEKENARILEYYVEGIGLVANIYEEGDVKVQTLLKSISRGAKKLAIEKYYPLDIDSNNIYINGEISFETNGDIVEKLESILKTPPSEEVIPAISPNTRINSLNLDRKDWKLKVDFSPELLLDMNYGSSMETKVLESIVNTLGRFYDVDGVIITVDGKAYESGHYYFREDESIEVNTKGLEEFKP